ncbi:MAG: imidazole glycerol phosphate synthase subunit HisH [Steroidobacteraceae bacterium]
MSARRAVIIDNGGANIASLRFALDRLGTQAELSADAGRIRNASHVLLPGVGAAGDAMQRLRDRGLDALIPRLTQPLLGICLGMQLLFDSSAEGDTACLGILPGRAGRLPAARDRPVPHMGWNTLQPCSPSPLLSALPERAWAYFVHSFALPVSGCTTARCDYGVGFSACVQRDNFFGTQFHPERSAAVGARVLQNFLALD